MKTEIYNAKLVKVKKLSPRVKFFEFDLGKKFDFNPGQFVMLSKGEVKRAYSLASQPGKKTIELCITIVPGGKMSTSLDKMQKDTKIKISGPYSKFGLGALHRKNDLVFIAIGTGVTPMRSLLNYLLKNGFKNKITLIYGFRYEEDFLFKTEFKKLAKDYSNFELVLMASRPKDVKNWKEGVGRVTAKLNDYIDSKTDFFICGLAQMIKDIKILLEDKGVKKEKIHSEMW